VQNGITIDGVGCDLDQAVTADFGQWPAPAVALAIAPAFRRRGAIDVNGDKIGDVCGRASDAVYCVVLDPQGNQVTIKGPAWSDASRWDQPAYGSTIRFGDIDGDGKSDVCGRASDGIHCEISDGTSFPTEVLGPPLSDANGWSAPQYYTTIELPDVNGDGKADLCARSSTAVQCWLSDGHGFPTAISGPAWSDAQGWAAVEYYSTLQYPDVNGDGKADVCARGAAQIYCSLSDGNGFPTAVDGPALSDASGWNAAEFYSTIQYPDVNGDRMADVCARANAALYCWLSNGQGFPTQIDGPPLSDANAWGGVQYYSTIQYADADGDGKDDLCARDSQTASCYLSTGGGFSTQVAGPPWSDANGWNVPQYYTTIQFTDIDADGKADVCGRSSAGVECWLSNGTAFATKVAGPTWSDANGWADPKYFTSLHVLSGVPSRAPSQDGGGSGGFGGGFDGSSSGGGGGSGDDGGAGWNGNSPTPGASGGCSCAAAGTDPGNPPVLAMLVALVIGVACRRRGRATLPCPSPPTGG
jgi:MYXO-CTERM domain-containing protein